MALVNVKKKIEKSADKIGLAPGEDVRAACTTNPTGSVKKMSVGAGIGGAVGAAVASAISKDKNADQATGMAAQYPQGQMFLAVTTQRVLVMSVAAMSGKPKEIVAEWPAADVTNITVEKGKMARPTTITFSDGSTAVVDAAKGSGAESVGELFS